ncbi:TRAP transporter permease [Brevibacterium luteolum]|uniref:TRAP transporter permease n=1 Tax=Brevibacterium luteolum TaxID=199591 RepID=UPI0021555751|nr:TRAP transporter permease [Brevibacterium luteolum]MCT1829232.1 TRAP transporter permease [Brevibacterium luteolum]
MTLVLMFSALVVLLALRIPVAFALLIPTLVYIIIDPTAVAALSIQQMSAGVFDFAILAVPMFILLGNLANVSGATERLYDAATATIGHVRGSLGYVNILTSFGFSWMSGAAISDAAAMGADPSPCDGCPRILPPIRARHHRRFIAHRSDDPPIDSRDHLCSDR